jgi:hypothetical protein
MDRKIKIKDLHVLNNIISRTQPKDIRHIIHEHHRKGRINEICRNEYRPGSEQYEYIEKTRAEILALPDHDIKYCGDVDIVSDRYGKTILSLTLGVYTVDEHHHDYDGCSYVQTVQYYFLVENQYWLKSIYTKFSDIFTENGNVISHMMDENTFNMFNELTRKYNDEYHKYIYLFKKEIMKALKYGYTVVIDQDSHPRYGLGKPYLRIDSLDESKKHYLEKLDKVLEIDYYWYDDRKVRFGDNYHFNSVMEEYEYAKDNVCEEQNS